jgi:hypothetical protein
MRFVLLCSDWLRSAVWMPRALAAAMARARKPTFAVRSLSDEIGALIAVDASMHLLVRGAGKFSHQFRLLKSRAKDRFWGSGEAQIAEKQFDEYFLRVSSRGVY